MVASSRKKIAIYYHAFMGGGAEAVGLWMLEALKRKYDLTLFTISGVDFDQLNSMYGTKLSKESVKVQCLAPGLLKPLSDFLVANNKGLRKFFIHLLIRYFKTKQIEYDLLASAYNAMDLGRRGIQYIHWVNVIEGNALHHKISGFSAEQVRRNISIVNSQVVANAARAKYGSDCTVVYPPVVLDVVNRLWADKENAFICSGRLTKAKQPHKIIEILSQVREQGFDIKLYLTGGGGGAYEWSYRQSIKQMAQKNSDWVTLHENLEYKDYVDLLSKCKYGIHFKQEPFGISIAEMVKAGIIPFVRSQGGQVEIVGEQNQALFFDHPAEAIKKIVDVLSNAEQQKHILTMLEERKKLFSTDRFMSEISKVVDDYFESQIN
ncbi:MAG: glycosyltransferase family 4 protein [Cyanothece sp. SIO1E1]|nr:glycosyltransferase family 4 protein [Cyanothece sp. SIO1E1]